MSDDLIRRLKAWDITDDDKAAIAAELARLRAALATYVCGCPDGVCLADENENCGSEARSALSAYEEARDD